MAPLRCLLSLCLTVEAAAFIMPHPHAAKPKASRRSAIEAIPIPAMSEGVRWAMAAPTLYGLMSANEYMTHRYYQHAEYNKDRFFQTLARVFDLPKKIRGGGHVEHHAETYDDMLLKTDDEKWMTSPAAQSLNDDAWRGTAFTWKVTGQMTLQMLPSTLPVFIGVLKFSLAQTVGILLPGMLLHALVWNALHPNMHGLPEVPASVGAPSSVLAGLRQTAYFRYLVQNHEGHHVVGGQANYNVACPLVDHLVGTYVLEREWRPKAVAFAEAKAAKGAAKIAAKGEAPVALAAA